MKIVAISDTHFAFTNTTGLVPDGDVLLHAGDLMYSGYPDEWQSRIDSLAALPHETKILVPGNHDFHIQNYNGIARAELRRRAKTTLLDGGMLQLKNGLTVLSVPFVTGLEGWAYNVEEEGLARYMAIATDDGTTVPDIVVSHGPMYQVLDAVHPVKAAAKDRMHVGSWALKKWFDDLSVKPKVFIHGHIHESYGRTEIDGCRVFNVAMCNREYVQANPGIVIDV